MIPAPRSPSRHRRPPRRAVAACVLVLYALPVPLPPPALASTPRAAPASGTFAPDQSTLCTDAAKRAAARTGVPEELLLAIALAESGRKRDGHLRPWPWALNVAGRGYWPESRDAARHHLRRALAGAPGHVDIGCFQINLHWHGDAFAGPEAMLDPDANALHAARFLARLHAETGDWETAAGLYHSRSPGRAAAYRARVLSLRTAPGAAPRRGAPPFAAPPAGPPRAASAPTTGGPGSLFTASLWAERGAARTPLLPLAPGTGR